MCFNEALNTSFSARSFNISLVQLLLFKNLKIKTYFSLTDLIEEKFISEDCL